MKRNRRSSRTSRTNLGFQELESRQMLATLVNGQEVVGNIFTGGSETFDFQADAGERIIFSVGETSGSGSPRLQITAPNGTIAGTNTDFDNALLEFTALQTGTYSAVVSEDGNNSSYGFRARVLTLSDVPQLITGRDVVLANGQEATGFLPESGLAVFPLEVDSTNTVFLSVGQTDNGFDEPRLSLFAPDGTQVGVDTDFENARLEFNPTQVGTYIAVLSDDDNDAEFDFRIRTVTAGETPELISGRDQALLNGQEFIGDLPLGGLNLFTVNVQVAQTVALSAGPLSGFSDPSIRVFAPDGSEMNLSNLDPEDGLRRFEATQIGDYLIVGADSDNDDDYQIRVRALLLGESPELIVGRDQALANGQEATGFLPEGGLALFPIEVDSNNRVIVSVGTATSSFDDVQLTVFAPDGSVAGINSDFENAFVEFDPTQIGTYQAVVSSVGNDDDFDFQIRTITIGETPGFIAGRDQVLTNGQEASGFLPIGGLAFFQFDVDSDNPIILSAGSQDDSFIDRPELTVYAPDGSVVATATDSENALIQFEPTQFGTYSALLTDQENDESFDFIIRTLTLGESPQLVADRDEVLVNGEEATGVLPVGGLAVFPFEVDSNNPIILSAGSQDEFFVDVQLTVYAPDGTVVQTNSDFANARIDFVPSQIGTYTAVLSEEDNDASFQFVIRTLTLGETPEVSLPRDQLLVNGQELTAELPVGGFTVFPISLDANQTAFVSSGQVEGFSAPVLEVYAPDGSPVDFEAPFSNGLVSFQGTEAGIYTVVASDASNDDAYELRIRALLLDETPQLIAGRDQVLQNGVESTVDLPAGGLALLSADIDAGQTVLVSAGGAGSGMPRLTVFAPDGSEVSTNSESLGVLSELVSTQSGVYTILLSNDIRFGDNSLNVRFLALGADPLLVPDRGQVLTNGQEVISELPISGQAVFPFEASAGLTTIVSAGRITGGNGATVRVFDPNGFEVSASPQSTGSLVQFNPAVTGTYRAVVSEIGNDAQMTFRIRSFTPALNPATDQSLSNGPEVTTVLPAGGLVSYSVPLLAGQTTALFASGDSVFESTTLTLFSPDGSVVASNTADGFARLDFFVPQSGNYTAVLGSANLTQDRSFDVRAVTLPGTPELVAGRERVILNGEELTSQVPLGGLAVLPIEIEAGQEIVLSVGELTADGLPGNAEPAMTVYGPNGTQLISTSGPDSAEVRFIASLTGTYRVAVSDAGNDEAFDFRIRSFAVPGDPAWVVGRDQVLVESVVNGSVPLGSFAAHPFAVSSGNNVSLTVDRTSTLGTVELIVFDANGFEVDTVVDPATAELSFTANGDGTYWALVSNSDNNAPLDFAISGTGFSTVAPDVVRFQRDGVENRLIESLSRPDQANEIDLSFNQNVQIENQDFTFFNETTGAEVVVPDRAFSYDSNTFTATWDVSPFLPTLLPAGQYRITASASEITDSTGSSTLSQSFSEQFLVALPGDVNLDGRVDVLGDAFALVGNLGQVGRAIWTDGDLNGDGNVDVLGDAFVLVANLGRSVVPPVANFASSSLVANANLPPVETASTGSANPILIDSFFEDKDEDDQDSLPSRDAIFAAEAQSLLLS